MGLFWLFPDKKSIFKHKTIQKNQKKRISKKADIVNDKKDGISTDRSPQQSFSARMIVRFFIDFSGNDDIKKNREYMSYFITYDDFARASLMNI
jgi:hypothetical protein